MEIKTEKITSEDLLALKNLLYINKQRQIKVTTFLFGLTACILFIPTPILSLLSRRAAPSGDTMFLFFDFGPMNVLLFMVIPLIIICVLVYFYILQIPNFKKDIETQEKEIGIVKVREIVELSERDKKDVLGLSDHIIKFENNPFDIDETYFLKSKNPEYMNAKAYRVEVSKYTKVEFKREIVDDI